LAPALGEEGAEQPTAADLEHIVCSGQRRLARSPGRGMIAEKEVEP
jgi:hypothetical protein